MIKISMEFASIEAAIVALGGLVKSPSKPQTPVSPENKAHVQAILTGQPAPAIPAAPEPVVKKRRGRSDKGVPRGSYIAAAVGAAPAAPTLAATPPTLAAASEPESIPPATVAPATQADAQKVLEKLFAMKGLEVARQAMSRFGANRMRDMKPEHYAEFVKHAEGVLAGGAV